VNPSTTLTELSTSVALPSANALLHQAIWLDAGASDNVPITKVEFHITSGPLAGMLIATATPTIDGWLATWDTTKVPDGSYKIDSVAYDTSGTVVYSNDVPVVVDNTPPLTGVIIPSSGATLSGNTDFDASASDNFGVTKVEFHLTGGSLSDNLIATAVPTIYGWLASWNSTTVSNGTYTLQSVAFDAAGNSTHSTGVTMVVNNPPPITTVDQPANGAVLSGTQGLDAGASPGVTSVVYEISGGSINHALVATAIPSIIGWVARWNTTSVPNGTYTLQSVASYAGGVTGVSSGTTITVAN
jgi:hypothetical protein